MRRFKKVAIVSWALWLGVAAAAWADCGKRARVATLIGWVVDARSYEHAEDAFSQEDDERLHTIAQFGPLLAFIEEGTNKVRPFYGFPSDEPVGRIPEQHAQYVGRRVSVTGCVSDSNWPSVTDVAQIEILG